MSKFIYFTPEEKARAQNTDLVSLLRAQGERPVRSGREFRTPNDPSITVRATLLPSPLSGGGFAFAGQKEQKNI